MGINRDPRFMQIVLLSTYAVVGIGFLQFSVTFSQVILTLSVCVALELLFVYWKQGKWVQPYSALITGLGISLALRAETMIPFLIAAIAAISLKHLVRYQGSHIFNPSNIGIVVSFLLLPATATDPLQWGYYLWILGLMSLGGFYLVYKVHRLPLVISFLAGFVGLHLVRQMIWPELWNANFSAFMWGGLFIFTFNMITDPKTSPKETKSQFVFGLSIALIAQLFIHLNVHNAVFISLALACAGRFCWKWIRRKGLFEREDSFIHAK